MSSNPFSDERFGADDEPNVYSPYQAEPAASSGGNLPNRRGKIGHVRVVATLLIVQGVCELVAATIFLGVAIYGAEFIVDAAQNNPAVENTDFTPEQLRWLTMGIYGTMGVATTIIGVLSIVAGIQALRFRGRMLSVVALAGGFLTMILGCYCFPTAMAIGIYGLIVMLDEPVKAAFNLRKAGWTPKQIKDAVQNLPS